MQQTKCFELVSLMKFVSVQDIHLHTCDNTSFMSRTDGASWSHFLRASLTDNILEWYSDQAIKIPVISEPKPKHRVLKF